MIKLIEMDEKANPKAKEIHHENLKAMVRYCENKTDCRRTIQLQYFGETFDSLNCRNSDTVCDNCKSGDHRKEDVTDFAKKVAEAVERLNMRARYDQKNFTVNHLVDIMRGSKNKKVLSCEWNKDPLYNSAEKLASEDCNRIVRMLVMQKVLYENLQINREGMASAYVKPGPKIQLLKSGQMKIEIDVQNARKRSVFTNNSVDNVETDETLKQIEEACFEELKRQIMLYFPDLKSCFSALPSECYQEIARKLPRTNKDMLEIEQMTETRFEKYGEILLEVCRQFYQKRQDYLQDKQHAQMLERQEDEEFDNAAFNDWKEPSSTG